MSDEKPAASPTEAPPTAKAVPVVATAVGHKVTGHFARGNKCASIERRIAAKARRDEARYNRTDMVFRTYLTPARLLEVVKRVYQEAKKGKSWACLEILNRFYGKPDQPHTLAGTTVDIKVLFAQAAGPGKEGAQRAVALALRRTLTPPQSANPSLPPPSESPTP